MRKRRTNIVLAIPVLAWTVIACTAGSGPFGSYDDPYDRAPNARDKPGDTRDKPGDTRDKPPDSRDRPPPSQDNPGSQGGNVANNCPPCDGRFKCTSMLNGKSDTDSINLQTINGECNVVDSKGKPKGVIACGGALTSDGKTQGTWQPAGPDAFTATSSGTVNGQQLTVTTTCVRDNNPAPKPTVTVTPTSTSVPKPPPTIVDAGKTG